MDKNGEIKINDVQVLLLAKCVAIDVPKDLPKIIILLGLMFILSTM